MKKFNFKEGDLIEITTSTQKSQGTLMQSPSQNLVIKLKNGYNLSMDKKDIKNITLIKKEEEQKEKKYSEIKINKNLPIISILHTGGTIASKVDYKTGAVGAKFSPQDLLEMFPELKDIANFRAKLVRKMWSDDLRFKHIFILAKEIKNEIKNNVDGIIIGIGTDNLAVASAALSFALESCPIPVILVGAQRSSDRGSSDAAINLICAANFITKTDFAGVAICMHENMEDNNCLILPACKTRKLHTSRRDAFRPVNDKPIAKVNYYTKQIEFFKHDHPKKGGKLIIKDKFEEKVALIKITINMTANQFNAYKGYKGLIIEGTGLGATPLDVIDNETKEHAKIKKALQNLSKNCVIVMTPQCIFGRINMNVYSKGRDLQEIGIIPGEDMLPETAFVKLSWLLANYPKSQVKQLIKENLRGEINKRILPDEFIEE
ncbi:MAG: Glu-tRNA(Gln) amidotransferase subunit GatD [Candidatus Woesearchaeota archaeon]